MGIDDFILGAIIDNNLLSLEYDVQQILEHQILVEASASHTGTQMKYLKELFDRARAYLRRDGNSLSVELTFLSVPKGMEAYAETIRTNSLTMVQTIVKDRIEETMTLNESQEIIREQIQKWAVEELQNALGGIG